MAPENKSIDKPATKVRVRKVDNGRYCLFVYVCVAVELGLERVRVRQGFHAALAARAGRRHLAGALRLLAAYVDRALALLSTHALFLQPAVMYNHFNKPVLHRMILLEKEGKFCSM